MCLLIFICSVEHTVALFFLFCSVRLCNGESAAHLFDYKSNCDRNGVKCKTIFNSYSNLAKNSHFSGRRYTRTRTRAHKSHPPRSLLLAHKLDNGRVLRRQFLIRFYSQFFPLLATGVRDSECVCMCLRRLLPVV